MASIAREGPGGERKKIVYRDAAGKQKSLRLGKCSERAAQAALVGFERVLEAARLGSTLHADGLRWLEAIDDRLHARVARLGLVQPRASAPSHTLGELLARFESASTVARATWFAYKQAVDSLRAFFGETKPLAEIAPADADAWRKALAESKLAAATVAKRVRVARAIFKRAVRWGLLPSSPFADLKAGPQSNPDRAAYIPPETIETVLAACPDAEWRATVGLSRYAGLRCPSEIALLRWGDINWGRGRLTVRSPKTAGHEGHAVRVVPIAPELRPLLLELFERAEPGTEAVIPRLTSPAGRAVNLRTHFERIIARAGVKPWPRLFHNLRASAACDWCERFPGHVVAGWLGHSPLIAAKHYLQARDAHFDEAAGFRRSGSKSGNTAAANPAARALAPDCPVFAGQPEPPTNPNLTESHAIACNSLFDKGLGPVGFEPTTRRL
ncbi:MAG: site-specific integrase [Phycisphaerales bacterium]|nr:site-specific integrase [Phycisphaerales bacterium]